MAPTTPQVSSASLTEPGVSVGCLPLHLLGSWPRGSPGLILMSVCGKACAKRRVKEAAMAHNPHLCILRPEEATFRPAWRREALSLECS